VDVAVHTSLELSGALSEGEAAYADRAMDGAEFDRENIGIKFRKEHLSERVVGVEAQAYYNYIDHVMDNYSLRDFAPGMMMPFPAASNPDRETTGGRIETELKLGADTRATVGIDTQSNEHAVRSTMNELMMPWERMDRVGDASFRQLGVFAELTHALDERSRLVGGLRVDDWSAKDKRETVRAGMMMFIPNPTAGETRDDTLESGFLRFEHDLEQRPVTLYAGLGHAERFPDYW
jgi:iron complex outermembrane receptor protein